MSSTSNYIPEAEGLKLNSQGVEVETLQRYLKKYGYLEESSAAETFSINHTIEPESETTAQSGVFDETTASALEQFQKFNNLPITGELDSATLAMIKRPRCGFPDVGEFSDTGRKWPSKNLTYGFENFTNDLSSRQIIQATEQAFALWSAVTELRFTRVAINTNPDIRISFVTGDHGDGNDFDGPSGVLAHAYFPPAPPNSPTPIQGDAHFDDAETWTVTVPPGTGATDLVTVAAHEFGHSLGLGHSRTSTALMAPTYTGPHRFLDGDDIRGIQAIYGGYPIEHAMWTHGNSVVVELPDRIEFERRYGFYTRFIGKPSTTNWFHFAVPTPVIVDGNRTAVGPVILRFRTGSKDTIARDVHIYDGESRISAHNGVNLSGRQNFARFGVAHSPSVRWGLGISVGVTFGSGSRSSRRIDFFSAGCDFRP